MLLLVMHFLQAAQANCYTQAIVLVSYVGVENMQGDQTCCTMMLLCVLGFTQGWRSVLLSKFVWKNVQDQTGPSPKGSALGWRCFVTI